MKSFTDISQSIKLQSILPIESADNHYVRRLTDFDGKSVEREWSEPKYGNPNSKYANYIIQNFESYERLPCWSLSALLSVLPFHLVVDNQRYAFSMIKGLDKNGETYAIKYAIFNTTIYFHLTDFYNNPVDSCYEMILKLHEQNLL
ncbi:hypothetical protein J6O48_13800 [bacterium]|nr:hypothetical protein [bacterium]